MQIQALVEGSRATTVFKEGTAHVPARDGAPEVPAAEGHYEADPALPTIVTIKIGGGTIEVSWPPGEDVPANGTRLVLDVKTWADPGNT